MPTQTPQFVETLEEMLLAIQASIEYLKNNGSSQVRIKHGQLINILENGFIYEFEMEWVQDVEEDADIEVKIGPHSSSGKVVACVDNRVQVLIDSHLGDEIASAILIISSYYLLEKLHGHLSAMISGATNFSSLAEKTLKLMPSVTAADESHSLSDLEMNESQEQAIKLSLGSEVTFIWGPPGTGKSETIAHLIRELIDRGKSVLLIAHTNAATDSVMLKVIKWLEGHPDYLDGKFLRVGSSKSISSELKTKRVVPEKIMEEKARPIRTEIERLEGEQARLSEAVRLVLKYEATEANLKRNAASIAQGEQYIVDTKTSRAEHEAFLTKYKERLDELEVRLKAYMHSGPWSKFFAGTNMSKLTAEKTQYLQAVSKREDQLQVLSTNEQRAVTKLNDLKRKRDILRAELKSFPPDIQSSEVKGMKKEIAELAEQRDELAKRVEHLDQNLIAEAKVIATTLTKSYMSEPILGRQYDCVILDEASMAPLPAVVSAAGLAQEKTVIVGDFFQLAPIANYRVDRKKKSDEEAETEQRLVDKWLKRDIFNYAGIEAAIRNRIQPDAWLTQLNTQYRMHPDISAVINKLIYAKYNADFKLLNGDNTLNNGAEFVGSGPLANSHVGIYDTHSMGALPIKSDSGSFYNLSHALVAIQLVKEAIKTGYTEIGIISAYRAQTNLMQLILKDELDENDFKKVAADTVHRFQGGAKELIIFDVTTSFTETLYDDSRPGKSDEKLMNVALSRAQDKCILIADVASVESKHSATSPVKSAFNVFHDLSYPTIEARGLTDEFAADDRMEAWLAKLNNADDLVSEIDNAKLFDQHDFYPHFIKDMLAAESEVIIQSAFITSNRTKTLKPIFQHLLNKGVRIYVLTRVPWEHNDPNMRHNAEVEMASLEDMGVTVLPFIGKIHQKFATVDRKILWDGSLNILSQRDSQEIMRRYEGSLAVEQYLGFLRIDKNIGPMGENHLKHCEVCEEPGAWMWTKKIRGKMWTFCLIGNHSKNMAPKTDADRKAREKELLARRAKAAKLRTKIKVNAKGIPICPIHDRELVHKKHAVYGEYWTCPDVKECDCTISDSQLAKLTRA